MKGIIYKCTCLKNNHVYIGETVIPFEKRIKEHLYDAKTREKKNKFHKYLHKYGRENFTWEILEEFNEKNSQKIQEILDSREKFWIDYYDSINNGMNTIYGSPIKKGNNIGENNPAYVKIDIDENEYFKLAQSGMNRKQLADHFKIKELHMKIWRKRMIAKNEKYRYVFKRFDAIRKSKSREKYSANVIYADKIESIKQMRLQAKTKKEIAKITNVPFSTVTRIIKAFESSLPISLQIQ